MQQSWRARLMAALRTPGFFIEVLWIFISRTYLGRLAEASDASWPPTWLLFAGEADFYGA